MILPYVRSPEYLSPSSLKMLEERPLEFYLRRCGPKETRPPEDPQGFPAAVGSAFDAYVKSAIAAELNLKCPPIKRMLKEKVETNIREAKKMGLQLVGSYAACGALAALREDQITRLEPGEKIRTFHGVPIRGDLDAVLRKSVPMDWKVIGAGAPGTRSPTPGYLRLWDTADPGEDSGCHKRCGEPLENVQEDWARQLTMYGWLLGWPWKSPLRMEYAVDEVIVGKAGRVRVAQHRGFITARFQRALQKRVSSAWARIQEEKVVPDEEPAGGCIWTR